MHGIGWTLVWLGALTLGFVAHQLWITTFFAKQNQTELASELEEHFESVEITEIPYVPVVPPGEDPPPIEPSFSSGEPGTPRVLQLEAPPDDGSAFAAIRIPSLPSLQDGWTVVEGVTLGDLRNGAGHMPWTPLPGQPGNSVISGHRTTYGQPFHDLDLVKTGDLIEVETALGVHVYAVREIHVVRPTDIWVTHPRAGAWLTLATCNPKFSARERLVIAAELVEGPNAEVILGRL
jgi:sortase A